MTASAQLEGLDLRDGWRVIRNLPRNPNGSGGTFSNSYLAEKNGRVAFVKAFDFSDAFEPGVDTLKRLAVLVSSYEHERDVLEHCRGRRLSHVAVAIDHGYVDVPNLGQVEGRVYYLLFEQAAGDIRCQMDEAQTSDLVWCMRALRSVCLGLAQVHREIIAHQDLKPSNVLAYDDGVFKIADFGRSSKRGASIWHDDLRFPGDRTYAPPELLYGFVAPDFVPRRMGTDLYMLGNLAAFLFTGTNMTGSLLARLDPQHHWTKWSSDYAGVLPYVQEAFARVLEELEGRLPAEVKSFVLGFVRQLCNPEPKRRGHPKAIGRPDQYYCERYIAELTHTVTLLELRARVAARSGVA
ncbi:serine/threonine-protein kinase [Mesorhizobium humile]|uniref:Serine/threonine-protein kinase n=1 Tax=Mesorhizobium humile TaxID=3072313 RepID=A0ABU4Y9J5_9HYPH|nr:MULTISPECIES: serine/threonine-protein kinase [unclassified Mesorhizobium]MDX8458187.1 serine/threonine-protein kinase [Mesorhizobium sp. VK2D]MDX8483600.1 serine/threonine-protein kinase [Mesorhizobium sp. VK2B]